MSRELLHELRRSPRIVCRVPILCIADGAPIAAHTAVISRHGAMILGSSDWSNGTVLEMQNQKTKETSKCRVVLAGGEDHPGIFKLGVEMLEDHPTFWADDYPPPPPKGEPEQGLDY